jgi:hypothetical protein
MEQCSVFWRRNEPRTVQWPHHNRRWRLTNFKMLYPAKGLEIYLQALNDQLTFTFRLLFILFWIISRSCFNCCYYIMDELGRSRPRKRENTATTGFRASGKPFQPSNFQNLIVNRRTNSVNISPESKL